MTKMTKLEYEEGMKRLMAESLGICADLLAEYLETGQNERAFILTGIIHELMMSATPVLAESVDHEMINEDLVATVMQDINDGTAQEFLDLTDRMLEAVPYIFDS